MISPGSLIWYAIIFFGLLNLGLFIILGDRYLYGAMVILFRLTQKDPFQCKVRAQPPVGPIEGVCPRMCKDYDVCERLGDDSQ